ncbi:hypothetical protein OHT93_20990 [Streptomyces sp. NBC_00191]|uniref:hypothetical protein n=1 Tax=Streptomyces sp. NBC_00191 TaxID=2975674 RepID=UPI00324A8C17
MTTAALRHALTPRHTGGPRGAELFCYATGAALIATGLFHLVVFFADGGPWTGPVSWRKPFTFGVSFGLTLVAITWVTSYLRIGGRARCVLLALFAADCVLEVAGITLQAWRGVPSHFNRETPFDSAVATALAVGGVLLVLILTTFATASFRQRPEGPAGMALALRTGFSVLLVGLLSGAAMIAYGVVVTRTDSQEAAYHSSGALKPLHGVSLHAILVLPVLARVLAFTSWPGSTREKVVRAASAAYLLAVVAAGAWALLQL